MKRVTCPRCWKVFIVESMGMLRPFFYHACEDGVINCVKNPDFGVHTSFVRIDNSSDRYSHKRNIGSYFQ
jgi:hypothetical protein